MQIRRLFVSPGHNFFGHHGRAAGEHPMIERDEFQCVAGRGVVGDRFFGYKPGYSGQITFFAHEVYEEICHGLMMRDKPPSVFRRNAITEGIDLNSLIGGEFEIQGVRFRGIEECRPCHWLDKVFAPGAEAFLKGRGGLRAVILSDGALRRDIS